MNPHTEVIAQALDQQATALTQIATSLRETIHALTSTPGPPPQSPTSFIAAVPRTYDEGAKVLAKAALSVARHIDRYSFVYDDPEVAQASQKQRRDQITRLGQALEQHETHAAGALEILDLLPRQPRGERVVRPWQAALAKTFISGVATGRGKVSARDLLAAFDRLSFAGPPKAEQLPASLAQSWVTFVRDGHFGAITSRKAALLLVRTDEVDFPAAAYDDDDRLYSWDGETWTPSDPQKPPAVFAAHDVDEDDGTIDRTLDAERVLLDVLCRSARLPPAATVRLLTTVSMCASCTVVALQFLHLFPQWTVSVHLTPISLEIRDSERVTTESTTALSTPVVPAASTPPFPAAPDERSDVAADALTLESPMSLGLGTDSFAWTPVQFSDVPSDTPSQAMDLVDPRKRRRDERSAEDHDTDEA